MYHFVLRVSVRFWSIVERVIAEYARWLSTKALVVMVFN